MLTKNERMMRRKFMPIAVLEHHQMLEPVLSEYDICDRLGALWLEIRREAQADSFTLDPDCIQSINERIARSLGMDARAFRNKERWAIVLDGIITEDGPVYNWLFSHLYWDHLTKFRISTAWLFTNAIRIQHKLPEYTLAMDRLGAFLDSLSGSGPPIYDGQTFDPEGYSDVATFAQKIAQWLRFFRLSKT